MTASEFLNQAQFDGKRMGAAVYAVEHRPSGRRLICCASCLAKRLWDQLHFLKVGKHYNQGVQDDLAKDGAAAFRFVLLTFCHDDHLLRDLKGWYIAEAMRKDQPLYNQPLAPSRLLLHHDVIKTKIDG